MKAWKQQPTELKIELALLTWWKIICIELQGNDVWKHPRDYKAVITLTKKLLEYLPNEKLKKILVKMEDYFIEHQENNIDWELLEKTRIIVHNYLIDLDNGKWNPAKEDLLYSMGIPEQWALERIRGLTNS